MIFTPFKETYEHEVHHFIDGDVVTDIACSKRFVAHVNDDCAERLAVRELFKDLGLSENRFYDEVVFTELNEDEFFSNKIIIQVGYGLNGGRPDGCNHDEKWAWYVEQIAAILHHLCSAGFGCPSLRFVNDPCRNDVYTCWIECYNKHTTKEAAGD